MNKQDFFILICTLEGFKSKFRELHWNAKLKSEHLLCDDIMDEIIYFQDNFAEEGFTFFGKFATGEFVPELNYSQTTIEALNELLTLIMENKQLLIDDINFCSLSALIDEMIHKVRKFITLTTYK